MSPATHLRAVPDGERVPEPGPLDMVRRRIDGTYELDPWGMDRDVTHLAAAIASVRWSATITGLDRLPADGPALLVANRRLGWSEPVVLASALARQTGWVVRPVGGTRFDPLAGILRRFGAIPGHPAEIDAALRAGNRVLVPTRREPLRNRAGHLPVEFLAPAVIQRVPLVPVAVTGWEFRRSWTIRIGEPVRVTEPARGVAADARLVGAAAVEVSDTLSNLLAEEHPGGLGHRLLSGVFRRGRSDPDHQWEVS